MTVRHFAHLSLLIMGICRPDENCSRQLGYAKFGNDTICMWVRERTKSKEKEIHKYCTGKGHLVCFNNTDRRGLQRLIHPCRDRKHIQHHLVQYTTLHKASDSSFAFGFDHMTSLTSLHQVTGKLLSTNITLSINVPSRHLTQTCFSSVSAL